MKNNETSMNFCEDCCMSDQMFYSRNHFDKHLANTVSIFAGMNGLKCKLGESKSWLMNGFISGYVAGVKTFGIY